jgi:hypothetical protein
VPPTLVPACSDEFRLIAGSRHLRTSDLGEIARSSWQVVPSRFEDLLINGGPAQAERVAQALFQMRKIVIADLEAAAAP